MPKRTDKKKKFQKPISLYGLDYDEMVKAFLQVDPKVIIKSKKKKLKSRR